MSSSINFKNILVVGVGLIGGSIIKALKESSFSGGVYGIDSDKSAVTSASCKFLNPIKIAAIAIAPKNDL